MVNRRRATWLSLFAGAGLVLSGCGSSSSSKPPPATTTTRPARIATTTSTTTGTISTAPQASGARTVLSPIGINVRAQPSTAAPVIGTAAEGTVLTVLAHSAANGGWYQVKGATVTGWITDNRTFSAPGHFKSYTSTSLQFTALYPDGWTTRSSPAGVAFSSPASDLTIGVVTASTVQQLPSSPAGYQLAAHEQAVLCGVTGVLTTFVRSTSATTKVKTTPGASSTTATVNSGSKYFATVGIPLDPQHALAVTAQFASLPQLQAVRDFANSITFPYPACQG